jgi:hypothetical protein
MDVAAISLEDFRWEPSKAGLQATDLVNAAAWLFIRITTSAAIAPRDSLLTFSKSTTKAHEAWAI